MCVCAYAGVSVQGSNPYQPDKPNQDAIVMVEDAATDTIILGVFDGHGDHGHLVSGAMRELVPAFLVRAGEALVTDPEGSLRGAIKWAEQQVLNDPNVDCTLSGSTCCVALIHGDELIVANVGDSRLVAVQTDGETLFPASVTTDHKPTLPSETRRILLKGGDLRAIRYEDGSEGPVRVWLRGQDIPGLAMSRSVGDTVAKKAGVTSEPQIVRRRLTRQDAFLVLASDGLWEFVLNEEVCRALMVSQADALAEAERDEEARVAAGDAAEGGEDDNSRFLRVALRALTAESSARWMEREGTIDDTTIILVELGYVPDSFEAAAATAAAADPRTVSAEERHKAAAAHELDDRGAHSATMGAPRAEDDGSRTGGAGGGGRGGGGVVGSTGSDGGADRRSMGGLGLLESKGADTP